LFIVSLSFSRDFFSLPVILSSSDQFSTLVDGLTQGTNILVPYMCDSNFRKLPISKEVVYQIVQHLSSISTKPHLHLFCKFMLSATGTSSIQPLLLLSRSLSLALLRIVQTVKPSEWALVLATYSGLSKTASSFQKRQVTDSEVWSVLLPFLGHDNEKAVQASADIIESLTPHRSGADYARFLKDGLFEQLMSYLPPPSEPITVVVPFARDGKCKSESFRAVGRTWSVFSPFSAVPHLFLF
jgi:hypothetical protein